jgi:hypothetical protein
VKLGFSRLDSSALFTRIECKCSAATGYNFNLLNKIWNRPLIGFVVQALERSLEAWQEKQQRYQLVAGHKMLHGTSLSDDENHVLITFLEATTALVRWVQLDTGLTIIHSTFHFFDLKIRPVVGHQSTRFGPGVVQPCYSSVDDAGQNASGWQNY